jgi:mRNA interferase MazF
MTGHSRGDLVTFKRRPALVVEADNLKSGIPQIVISMITSNLTRRGHPSRVFIALDSIEAREAGRRTDSIIMTDNLATVLEKAIAAKLGHLKILAAVDAALRHTLAL